MYPYRLPSFLVALSIASGCSSSPSSEPANDGGPAVGDSETQDGTTQDGTTPDSGFVCSGSLDAGFSTLADLPIATLCSQSVPNGGSVVELQCGSWTLVQQGFGGDCSLFWLFATSGALVATGNGCNTTASCTGAAPGFEYPSECIPTTVTEQQQELCAQDGGVGDSSDEATVPDAASDAPGD